MTVGIADCFHHAAQGTLDQRLFIDTFDIIVEQRLIDSPDTIRCRRIQCRAVRPLDDFLCGRKRYAPPDPCIRPADRCSRDDDQGKEIEGEFDSAFF
ncbi:hypothetical protein SDC9_158930 [bioreactor metagenome]|uniref:Uncharacterized protein n=1 Tax=bioreactor metagenome TaxID=1076179 RepID=A0A645FDG4_9ZZZZ